MNKHNPTVRLSSGKTPDCWRRVAAACLLALTLVLNAGVLIHPLLHDDAGETNHDCAFVHWANGELGFSQADLAVAPTAATSRPELLPSLALQFPSAPEFPRHARGPPLV